MVSVRKTIRCKLNKPTKLKVSMISIELDRINELMQFQSAGIEYSDLYLNLKKKVNSGNLHEAERKLKKYRYKSMPLIIRKDLIKIKKTANKLSKYWIRIPVKAKRGGIWLPISSQPFDFENYEICESKLYKKKDDWFVNINIRKDVELSNTYTSTLSVDLGEKYMGCSVNSSDASLKPTFYGKEVRGIRRKYSYIRKQLQKKGLLKELKRLGDIEQRKVTDTLNKISSRIVKEALTSNSLIVLGDLKGIRNSAKGKGKRFNRIVSNMPYYQLTQMIEYKANWEGIKVLKIPEAYTSKTCSKCGSRNTLRQKQSLFHCKDCSFSLNADVNGSRNILNRSNEYILSDRVSVNIPKTNPELEAHLL